MNRQEIEGVLTDVSFAGYRFVVSGMDRLYLQGIFDERCSVTGALKPQHTRKWYLSKHATRGEVVQTALKLVLTAVEHEARETFRYRGRAIFGPHFDVDELHAICTDRGLDYRRE